MVDISTQHEDYDDAKQEFYRYFNDLNGCRTYFEEKERTEKHDEKLSVLRWISASKKTHSLHKQFQDMRICPDTGRWLFKRYSEVTEWMRADQHPESAIWLHASKGFGNRISHLTS